jgi:hypothetical protein
MDARDIEDSVEDMNRLNRFIRLDFSMVLCAALFLSACGGGSGGDSANGTGSVPGGGVQNTSGDLVVLYGSVGDGPIVGAKVKVFDKDRNFLVEQTSDNTASYEMSMRVNSNAYPLILEASGGQDMVTGGPPDFILNSVLMASTGKTRVNINPFSTLMVQLALDMPGGLTAANFATAQQVVLQQMNFGFDQTVMSDPVTSPIDETNIGVIIRSSEALGEMLRRTRNALQLVEPSLTADRVVSALAADLTDGVVDGVGTPNADARIAAIANVASAQVLVEVMTGALNVNNADASAAMDNAALVSMPSTTATTSVNDLPISVEMLAQTKVVFAAVQAVDSNPLFVEAGNALGSIQANGQANNQPADLAVLLPASISSDLSNTLINVAVASAAGLEQVNRVVRQGGQTPGKVNSAPVINGVPATGVTEGIAYHFAPSANDADGDTLSFSVSNLPGWASFSPVTGAITGTPSAQDVGLWSAIVISVSDGAEVISLPTFSISVGSLPNTAPTISGTPAWTVVEGAAYYFSPSANDTDGDKLSFSVSNLPGWASFSAATGAISGTPSAQDVGFWSAIAISVSDGVDVVSLPTFSITVSSLPNTAPTISGTPAWTVAEGSTYYFSPSANDADGDALSFSVSSLPSWASFNSSTGAITGTPSAQDVGLWSAIVISVSDGVEVVSLPTFSITVSSLPNIAPTISGTPASTVEEGVAYVFAPSAYDADGDTLSFSVSSLPSWASFNSSTGAVTGTPVNLDVGVTSNIVISVSDGVASVSLSAFSINVTAASTSTGTATLSWLPPTENTDGSVLTDLAGYKIYYGTTAGNYTSVIMIDNPGIASYVVDNLPGGNTYFFVITSVTSSGLESEYSSVGSKTIL